MKRPIADLSKEFDMKDQREARKILGMEIKRIRKARSCGFLKQLCGESIRKVEYVKIKTGVKSYVTIFQVIDFIMSCNI